MTSPKLPSRARLRTLGRIRSLTTGLLLGTSAVSLLSSAVACDPAPPPPICGDFGPTAYGGILPDGLIEVILVVDENDGHFDPVEASRVDGGALIQASSYEYTRLLIDADDGAALLRIRAKLRCQPSIAEDDEEDLPNYEIVVELGDDPQPGDPLKVTITEI